MKRKRHFSLNFAMEEYCLLKTLGFFIFFPPWKSKCPNGKTKSKQHIWGWANPSQNDVLWHLTGEFLLAQWLMGVTALSSRSLIYVLLPSKYVSHCIASLGGCKASRRIQYSQAYGQLWGTIVPNGAWRWLEMDYSHFWTMKYLSLKCQNISKVTLFRQNLSLFTSS